MDLLKQWLDPVVFSTLGLMSLLMLAYAIERYLHYSRLDLSSFQSQEKLEIDLSNHLTIIASVGSNAPYIGLLGTVLGILITFFDLGQAGLLDASNIMTGLALALKATAMGLLVAIPSIVFYNGLQRKAEVLRLEWQHHQRMNH